MPFGILSFYSIDVMKIEAENNCSGYLLQIGVNILSTETKK